MTNLHPLKPNRQRRRNQTITRRAQFRNHISLTRASRIRRRHLNIRNERLRELAAELLALLEMGRGAERAQAVIGAAVLFAVDVPEIEGAFGLPGGEFFVAGAGGTDQLACLIGSWI